MSRCSLFEQISIDETWFRDHGAREPDRALREWTAWLNEGTRTRSKKASVRKLLQLASGRSAAAVGFYFQVGRQAQLSLETIELFDTLMGDLGCIPEPRSERSDRSRVQRSRSIAVLTSLADIPSESFHLSLLRSLAAGAAERGFDCTLHETDYASITDTAHRLSLNNRPSGVVLVRITPTPEMLGDFESARIPVVLIHADKQDWGPPVIANILPDQSTIPEALKMWARSLAAAPNKDHVEGIGTRDIVIAAMRAKGSHSVRSERTRLMRQALTEFAPKSITVPNYSFRHALTIVREHPNAMGYVCLSDQLAVGVAHLLIAMGRNPAGRVVGFDDSKLSEEEEITSFGQHLESIGQSTVAQIVRWHDEGYGSREDWPSLCSPTQPVVFVPRSMENVGDILADFNAIESLDR